jgi:hypothetical protein
VLTNSLTSTKKGIIVSEIVGTNVGKEAIMKSKLTYKFRLSQKDVQSGLKQHIDELAEQRKLTDELKIALTLLAQLQKGNTELLNELFPNVCAPKPTPPNTDEINRRLANIEAKLEERPIVSLPEIPDTRSHGFPAMAPKAAGQGIGTLANRTIAMPIIEDEPDDGATIVLNVAAHGTSNGGNLIAGILGLD